MRVDIYKIKFCLSNCLFLALERIFDLEFIVDVFDLLWKLFKSIVSKYAQIVFWNIVILLLNIGNIAHDPRIIANLQLFNTIL